MNAVNEEGGTSSGRGLVWGVLCEEKWVNIRHIGEHEPFSPTKLASEQ